MDSSPKPPKVTVLMPAYNASKYIGVAIQSILSQTLRDLELIIVNDGSTDNTKEVIESFSDNRIRLITNESNLGIILSSNKGLSAARGTFVALMDSDDISSPNRLASQASLLESNPSIAACGSWAQNIGAAHHVSKPPTSPEAVKASMIFENVIINSSAMVRRDILIKEHIEYREQFPNAQDYDLWARLSMTHDLCNIGEPLIQYRIHPSQDSQNNSGQQKKSGLAVKIYLLEQINVKPTELELQIHQAISTYRYGETTDLDGVLAWLVKLKKHNDIEKNFPSDTFNNVLRQYAEKWLIYSQSSGLLSYFGYIFSPFLKSHRSLEHNATLGFAVLARIPLKFYRRGRFLTAKLKHRLSGPYQALQLEKDILIDQMTSPTNNRCTLGKTIPANPKIGIAILALNRPEYLRICLDSLFQTKLYNYDVTFLIQDDGSTDPEVRKVINREYDPKYKIIRRFNDKCHGSWGGAFNSAMKTLLELDQFDIIGSCDSDAYFHPQWLDKTIEVARWAKQNHKVNCLGPFSSFNSSDTQLHRIMGKFSSPYGSYVVKQRMGAVNYLYLVEDFLKLGYFVESKDDETLMSEKFKRLRVRNFCTDISYVEHVGHYSTLDQWRPVAVEKTAYGLNLAPGQWLDGLKKYNLQNLQLHPYRPEKPDRITKLFSSVRFQIGLMLGVSQTRVNNKLVALAKRTKVEISLRKILSPTPSQLKLDIVIAAIDKDLEILPHVIASARKNLLHPIGNIFIICPQSSKMTQFGIDHDCAIVDENTLLPIKKDDLSYVIYGENRNGWLFQQLLKLAASALSKEENYLILDADTVLACPQVFEKNGKIVFDASDEYNRSYLDVYQKLTGNNDLLPISCVSHHSLINQAVLKELKQLIEKRSGLPWYKGIVEYTDYAIASGFSEYETYANFFFHNHKEKMVLEYWKNLSLTRSRFTKVDHLINKYHNKYKTISFHHYK